MADSILSKVAKGLPWQDIPQPTCPDLDKLLSECPEQRELIEQIRQQNSELRYGYFATMEITKSWRNAAQREVDRLEKGPIR